MKITFENIRWRFENDDEITLRMPFNVKHTSIGELKKVTYDDESGECKVYGVLNTFGFHCYGFRHQTQGLERTTFLAEKLLLLLSITQKLQNGLLTNRKNIASDIITGREISHILFLYYQQFNMIYYERLQNFIDYSRTMCNTLFNIASISPNNL